MDRAQSPVYRVSGLIRRFTCSIQLLLQLFGSRYALHQKTPIIPIATTFFYPLVHVPKYSHDTVVFIEFNTIDHGMNHQVVCI
jgi:hypothetical protein